MSDENTTNEAPGGAIPDEEMPEETFLPLRMTAEAAGMMGGDSHATYAFFAVEGQALTVRLNWDKHEEFPDNTAGVSISFGNEGFGGGSDVFKRAEAEREETISGTIPRTGTYQLFVVAHPVADYRLRVTLE